MARNQDDTVLLLTSFDLIPTNHIGYSRFCFVYWREVFVIKGKTQIIFM